MLVWYSSLSCPAKKISSPRLAVKKGENTDVVNWLNAGLSENLVWEKLPKNSWLVCYCACPHAESGALANRLLQAGFKKVTVLDEGLGAWAQKKYPVSSGEKP